jgi:hypothetical protein
MDEAYSKMTYVEDSPLLFGHHVFAKYNKQPRFTHQQIPLVGRFVVN